jgi:hypothetical protein
MDSSKCIREGLPDPNDIVMDAEIWCQDSHELHDLAESLVNRHPRFAWLVVDAWMNKHDQILIDK